MGEQPLARRQALAAEIQEHADACPRCRLKVAYDMEWEARVGRALRENKGSLGLPLSGGPATPD